MSSSFSAAMPFKRFDVRVGSSWLHVSDLARFVLVGAGTSGVATGCAFWVVGADFALLVGWFWFRFIDSTMVLILAIS
jgi:hypothetical protein